jgi:hypothetical protein
MAERVNKESMPCNRPRPANDGKHKRVVKACSNGQEKIVRYGAKGYSSNYSAEARKQYRRRHAGEGNQSKLTAGYWAYHDLWSAGSKVYREGKSSGVGERFKKRKSIKKALS